MQVHLYDRFTQTAVSAEIVSMTECHFQLANSSWAMSFQQRYRNQRNDDDLWMWNASIDNVGTVNHRYRMRSFALIVDERILGVLFLQSEAQLSRLQFQSPLVYVRYVATAPWNRPDQCRPGRLRGVGTALIAWATEVSRESGCSGRLGLHSLQSSDAFYLRLGFRNLGLDAARRGMTYFELPEPNDAGFSKDVCHESISGTWRATYS